MGSAGRRPLLFAAALMIAGSTGVAGWADASGSALDRCLGATVVVRLSGTYRTEVRYPSPAKNTTFDARGATFLAYPQRSLYPFSIGKETAPSGTCVVGGFVVGQQPRTLTWDEMKNAYDGDGLRIASHSGYIVDGLRVDNIEDGVAPRGTENRYPKDGDGFVMRNLYFTYIRDDCVENDDIAGGVITDSLFDGCYTGVSERPSDGNPQLAHPAPAGETLVLDHVLLRLRAMPGPRGTDNRSVGGHGQLFKWSSVGNSLVVKHSVFLIEKVPNSSSYFPFPPRTVTQDVTLVWLGVGAFHWRVPAGTTVTTDRSVWDDARAAWLARHGCTSVTSCSRIDTPAAITARAISTHSPEASPIETASASRPPLPSTSQREVASRSDAGSPSNPLPLLALALAMIAVVVVALGVVAALFASAKRSPGRGGE